MSISNEKTDAIKLSDSEALIKLLTKERQLIQTVEQLEEQRMQLVEQYFLKNNMQNEEKSITNLLNAVKDGKQKHELEQIVAQLIQHIVSIRESEQLNSDLLQQSMQFVQLSLDMIQPQAQTINYGDHAKQKKSDSSQKRSVFDSKI